MICRGSGLSDDPQRKSKDKQQPYLCYMLNSFQTALTPNPEKLYDYCDVMKQYKHVFECALQVPVPAV